MPNIKYFSETYQEARSKFISLAENLPCDRFSYTLNVENEQDREQTLELNGALVGSHQAKRLLVITSATHGIEGYCGSAVQCALLDDLTKKSENADIAFLFLHAINPYGFTNDRRVNENNVDLNRNFIQFPISSNFNPNYEYLHSALVPENWNETDLEDADETIQNFIRKNSDSAYIGAVTGGQYEHSDGLFYGGVEPQWSNRTWCKIVENYMSSFEQIGLIDIHTGLGPYGYGELMHIGDPESSCRNRAEKWLGEPLTCPFDGSSSSAPIEGAMASTLKTLLPKSEITAIALEFGTQAIPKVLHALRMDNWYYAKGQCDIKTGVIAKKLMREAFYPSEDKWKKMILERSLSIVKNMSDGLSS